MSFIETACLIGHIYSKPLYWHTPPDRSAVYIPDSRTMWDEIWQHRKELTAIAHTHPGAGIPHPSAEDITTFAATEAALGKRLQWWILTEDDSRIFFWRGPDKYQYEMAPTVYEFPHHEHTPPWMSYINDHPCWPDWMKKLRKLSQYEQRTITVARSVAQDHI